MTEDFLANLKCRYALIPPGRYQVAMVPRDLGAYTTAKTGGVYFTLAVVGGDHDGDEVQLRLLTEGTPAMDRMVRRDVGILVAWAEGLGVPPVKSRADLVKELGRRGLRRVIHMSFAHQNDAGGVGMIITKVEVAPEDKSTAPASGDGEDDEKGAFA